jgi:hypothetical protein
MVPSYVRPAVGRLLDLGPLPQEELATPPQLELYQSLLGQIDPPVTDEEARVLMSLFGNDDCFGAAWTLLHLIETAPHLPIATAPADSENEWVRRLWARAHRDR